MLDPRQPHSMQELAVLVGFLLQRSAWVPGATTAHGHCVWLLLTLLAASSSQSCSPSATPSPVSGLWAALWQRAPTPSISPSLPRLGAVKDWYMSQCVLALPHFIRSFCSWLPALLIYDDFRPRCRGNRLLLLLQSPQPCKIESPSYIPHSISLLGSGSLWNSNWYNVFEC